ncbi:MAG: hypothetical protein EG826_14440, partial [Deltaproteobacteria bacterium]|nr:hypothetical protein [Deltaproteobacteria bacterium]
MSVKGKPEGAVMPFYRKKKMIRKMIVPAAMIWIILSTAHPGSAGAFDAPKVTDSKETATTTRPAAVPDAQPDDAKPSVNQPLQMPQHQPPVQRPTRAPVASTPRSAPQPEDGVQPGDALPQISGSYPSAAKSKAIALTKGNVSLNFDDADIYSVIQTVFGEILKYNYIIDAKVKGRVTFRSVAPVPREKVLPLMEVILRLNSVAIIEESDLYRIIPIGDLSREPSEIKIGRKIIDSDLRGKAVLQIVPLNYVQSTEIVKLISPFVSANAVIVDVSKANHIIIADTDANVKRILGLIEYFDSEMKEKKGVRVFVYHVQNAKSKDIVTMLQQIFLGVKSQQTADRTASSVPTGVQTQRSPAPQPQSVAVAARGSGSDAIVSDFVKIFADEKLNAVVILGTREDFDVIKQTITELDLIPRQVLIEGTIASIQLKDNMNLGLAWSLKTNIGNLNPINISLNPKALQIDPEKPTDGGLNIIGVDSGTTVRAVINALATQSKAKLLASPHIMVSDNNEARIQVGQQVPITTSETYGSSTLAPQRTIQYKDIGIILKVKPQINDSGLVNLQLSQEVSTYTTEILYSNEKQIILNKTEATTSLVVKNGQTIVIGGLIREDDSHARSGIPWLTKIPLLGYLFGNTTKENNRTELVILLTPYIVKDENEVALANQNILDDLTDKKMGEELRRNFHRKAQESKMEGQEKN